jgi:hypothetical protein
MSINLSYDNSANAGGNTVNTPTYDKGITALLVVVGAESVRGAHPAG